MTKLREPESLDFKSIFDTRTVRYDFQTPGKKVNAQDLPKQLTPSINFTAGDARQPS